MYRVFEFPKALSVLWDAEAVKIVFGIVVTGTNFENMFLKVFLVTLVIHVT